MQRKSIFLFLLLLFPVLIVSFLYIFGKNKFEVKGNRLAGTVAPSLKILAPADGSPVIVGLIGNHLPPDGITDRVISRVERIHTSEGRLGFHLLGMASKPDAAQSGLVYQPADSARLVSILTKELGLPADTGGLGYWYFLLRPDGSLANAYDLRQERLLDTLAIEATILSGAKQ